MGKYKVRKYYRKCGECGESFEQTDGYRVEWSPNGWVCCSCFHYIVDEPDFEDM